MIRDLKYLSVLSFDFLIKNETPRQPRLEYSGKGSLKPDYAKPVCFFCSYDKESTVRRNVFHYLNELVQAGFNVVFISSSDTISDADLKKLSKFCVRIIIRENKGHDFYGWKTGLREYPQYRAHSALLLANDSVLGPLFSIRDIIAKLEDKDADIVGMTDCLRFHPHLQSYFLYCKKSVVASEEFAGFFERVEVLEFKMAIIRRYEVGFSRLLSHRFKLSALYNLEDILDRVQYLERPKNQVDTTFHLWKPLITEFQFPFLKKSILTRRGISIEEVAAALADSNSSYTADILSDCIVSPISH
ncbi:rhamnan synthesis F family protein [Nitrosospira sp. NpAV]|uniref:rhamnan synthesis F family protein n=1 Tax=Nitrosospira sp. NpAV TaxID=58133 RepID=UPI000AF24906|nr:rhamnan synthesis F family protein [Nitrosospira sp. NpAV]